MTDAKPPRIRRTDAFWRSEAANLKRMRLDECQPFASIAAHYGITSSRLSQVLRMLFPEWYVFRDGHCPAGKVASPEAMAAAKRRHVQYWESRRDEVRLLVVSRTPIEGMMTQLRLSRARVYGVLSLLNLPTPAQMQRVQQPGGLYPVDNETRIFANGLPLTPSPIPPEFLPKTTVTPAAPDPNQRPPDGPREDEDRVDPRVLADEPVHVITKPANTVILTDEQRAALRNLFDDD